MSDSPFRLHANWPEPYNTGAAERLIERFAGLGRTEARLAARPAVAALLRSLGGNLYEETAASGTPESGTGTTTSAAAGASAASSMPRRRRIW